VDIVVLLKQVPSTESFIEIADDKVSVKTDDFKMVINPYDEYAVEEAIQLREIHGGSVTILSAGSEKTTASIRTALAMGADKGVLIQDPVTEECDSLGTARILAAALKQIPFDLIIAGQRAVDDDNFQVGIAVAEYLNIPHVSLVNKEEIIDGKIRCHRTVEGGTVVFDAPLPALFTTQRGLNEPRYASLPGIMKAKKKPLDVKTLADIGLDVEKVGKPMKKTVNMQYPPERTGGMIIEGETAQEKAASLVKILHEESKVI
jgi:electron transfer flavoprotein beta subunit